MFKTQNKKIESYINKVFEFGNEYTIEELLKKYKDVDYTVSKKELLNKPIYIILLKLTLENNNIKYFLYQTKDFDKDFDLIKYYEITNDFNINKIKKDLEKINTLDNTLF